MKVTEADRKAAHRIYRHAMGIDAAAEEIAKARQPEREAAEKLAWACGTLDDEVTGSDHMVQVDLVYAIDKIRKALAEYRKVKQ